MKFGKEVLNIVRRVSQTGAHHNANILETTTNSAINIFSLITIIFSLLSMVVYNHTLSVELFMIHILLISIGMISLFLASKGNFDFARLTVIIGIPTIQAFNAWYFTPPGEGLIFIIILFLFILPVYYTRVLHRFLLTLYLGILIGLVAYRYGYLSNRHIVFNIFVFVTTVIIGLEITFRYIRNSYQNLLNRNDEVLQYSLELEMKNTQLKDLLDKNKMKTNLLGALSHDLKGPAISFNNLSQNISYLIENQEYEDLQKLGDYYSTIGLKLFGEIDRLLNWVIAQKEEITVNIQEVNVFFLVNKIHENLAVLSNRNVLFNFQRLSRKLVLNTDENILTMILNNLLSNAFRYSRKNSTIYVYDKIIDGNLIICIKNEGEAIKDNIIVQAKTNFYTESKGGHGLGLAICLSMVKVISGSITITRLDDKYNCVSVILPQ